MTMQLSRAPNVWVCVVARNYLASAHLREVLRKDASIRVVSTTDIVAISPRQRSMIVIVIDNCGLDMPLSRCIPRFQPHCPAARFLVLDDDLPEDEIVRLLLLGAHGFLPHHRVRMNILAAVRHLARGGLWVSPQVLHSFLSVAGSALRNASREGHVLTPRELQVLELVKRRLSNDEIATLLRIQVSTVKFHLSNILAKLHSRSRRDLFDTRLQHNWDNFPALS